MFEQENCTARQPAGSWGNLVFPKCSSLFVSIVQDICSLFSCYNPGPLIFAAEWFKQGFGWRQPLGNILSAAWCCKFLVGCSAVRITKICSDELALVLAYVSKQRDCFWTGATFLLKDTSLKAGKSYYNIVLGIVRPQLWSSVRFKLWKNGRNL